MDLDFFSDVEYWEKIEQIYFNYQTGKIDAKILRNLLGLYRGKSMLSKK